MNLTKRAHQFINDHFADKAINIAVDATCGNGHDSLFLAKRATHLFCFDIQPAAIQNTQALLESESQSTPLNCVTTFIQDSHSNLCSHLRKNSDEHADQFARKIDIAMFNLGFLPKSADLKITTEASSTATAIQQAMQCLATNGLISILCYRGHPGSVAEFKAVQKVINSLDQTAWRCQQFDSIRPNESTPILLLLTHNKIA